MSRGDPGVGRLLNRAATERLWTTGQRIPSSAISRVSCLQVMFSILCCWFSARISTFSCQLLCGVKLSSHPSVHHSIHGSVCHPSIHHTSIHPSLHSSLHPSVNLSVRPSVFLSLSIRLSVSLFLSVRPSVFLSLSFHLSVHLSQNIALHLYHRMFCSRRDSIPSVQAQVTQEERNLKPTGSEPPRPPRHTPAPPGLVARATNRLTG